MFRKSVLLIAALFISITLSATSIMDNPPADPFPIEENVSLYDFDGNEEKMEDFRFALLTTDKGDEIYTLFGHSGLELTTPDGRSRTYDWGVFDFENGFYLNFIRGRLYYIMNITGFENSIFKSEFEGRTLRRMDLLIPETSKRDLIAYLNRNALAENRTYLYDFYLDNCATRVRDLYNATTHDGFRNWAEKIETGKTIRDLTIECMRDNFPVNWFINSIQGRSIDSKVNLYEACFLPSYLEMAISSYQGTEPQLLVEGKKAEAKEGSYLLQATLVSILVTALLFLSYRLSRRLWALLTLILSLGLLFLSLVFTVLMFCSYHWSSFFNENLIFINPSMILVTAVSIITVFRPGTSLVAVRRYFTALSLAIVILLILKLLLHTILFQANLPVILPMLILYLGQAYTLRKEKPLSR